MQDFIVYVRDSSGRELEVEIRKAQRRILGGWKLWVQEVGASPAISGPSPDLSPLELAEKTVIEEYLEKLGGNKNRARKALGITINTLNAKIKTYGIRFERVW